MPSQHLLTEISTDRLFFFLWISSARSPQMCQRSQVSRGAFWPTIAMFKNQKVSHWVSESGTKSALNLDWLLGERVKKIYCCSFFSSKNVWRDWVWLVCSHFAFGEDFPWNENGTIYLPKRPLSHLLLKLRRFQVV